MHTHSTATTKQQQQPHFFFLILQYLLKRLYGRLKLYGGTWELYDVNYYLKTFLRKKPWVWMVLLTGVYGIYHWKVFSKGDVGQDKDGRL